MHVRPACLLPLLIVTCVLNAYFRWAGLPVLPKLKQAEEVLATYAETDIQKIVKGKSRGVQKTCVFLLVDTGMRIDEALSIEAGVFDGGGVGVM